MNIDSQRGHEPFNMLAGVMRTPGGGMSLEDVRMSPPRADEVLVRNVGTGICHTDLNVMRGFLPSALPIVLGHEGSGVVVSVGADVRDVAVGDHVVMTYLTCGVCRECTAGHGSSCRHAGELCFSGARPDGTHAVESHDGSPLHDRFFGQSSFAQYSIAHRNNVVKVPRELPLALLGPLGCGLITGAGASWNVLEVGPGMSFAAFGVGAVGFAALMAARVAGASVIVAVDRVPARLALARELGATHVVDASTEDVGKAIRAIAAHGIDRTIDTTGRREVMQTAVQVLGQQGVAAFVAHTGTGGELGLDVKDLILGSKTVRGVIEGGRSAEYNIARILDHYKRGEFPFERLIKTYRPSEIDAALDDTLSGAVIKPVICWE
jgi:aryl-alcohol dehydrogenase